MPDASDHRERVESSHKAWLKHRQICERYRVKPGDRRTTPPPPVAIAEIFPELAGQTKTTVRLHPRVGDEPPIDASKIGGTLLWPAQEPWPICHEHDIRLIGVLQLRAEDFPEMPFPRRANLFQLLWCPREHKRSRFQANPVAWAVPSFYWRCVEDISVSRGDNPAPVAPYYEYVPFTCRLMPERVTEYPWVEELPDDLVRRISEWEDHHLNEKGEHQHEYEAEFVLPQSELDFSPVRVN